MSELSVREMRAGYHVITEALERDGEVVLTHHGKPFAKVVPIAPQVADVEAAVVHQRRQFVGAERFQPDLGGGKAVLAQRALQARDG